MPLTASAGYVAHSPSTATRLAPYVAMFQIAGARRMLLVIGSFAPVCGSNCTKSRIPWSSGLTPVIIDVQTSGDSGGLIVSRVPLVPSRTSRARFGILPFAV